MDCYWVDNNNGMAAFQMETSPEYTTVSCLEQCTTFGNKYAATQINSFVSIDNICQNETH